MNETIPIQAPARNERTADTVERGLSVVSIAKSYDRKVVLSDVSVSVERGEVLGLLGPNGAGKTTCFYSIMGLVKPDSGRILLDGQDITGLPMYRRAILGLGYLPQETSIFRGLTVAQNIMAVLEIAEPDRSARRDRLEQLLSEFHLERLREDRRSLVGRHLHRCAGSGRQHDGKQPQRALARRRHFLLMPRPVRRLGHCLLLYEIRARIPPPRKYAVPGAPARTLFAAFHFSTGG